LQVVASARLPLHSYATETLTQCSWLSLQFVDDTISNTETYINCFSHWAWTLANLHSSDWC
jgi:hypothetical protein